MVQPFAPSSCALTCALLINHDSSNSSNAIHNDNLYNN